jgi:hypothetical protein
MDMKLEVVVLSVYDVDRAKAFYEKIGFRQDIDYVANEDYRIIQFTPPGSEASIIFGKGITSAQPGSIDRLVLAVYDIDAARPDPPGRFLRLAWLVQRSRRQRLVAAGDQGTAPWKGDARPAQR